MGKHVSISNKFLGILIFIALIIQYILPMAGIKGFSQIAIIIYLVVGVYLLIS